jgi:anaerobic selenocysteine-containing dehydrogenase
MHVLIAQGRLDRDYIARATLGFERLAEHVRQYSPELVAPIVGLAPETIVGLARRYGASPRSFIRIGIGLSRHDNGGMTCRTLACLPALTGAYADPHGGALLSSDAAFGLDYAALERPDLMPNPPPRVINMVQLGRALTDAALTPPVKSLYVYSSNPAAVCPHQTLVLRGLARPDLFTVVHEQVLTDTALWADLVLPATTSMEHADLYRSFGQFYLQYAEPVLPAPGQARSNWEVFAALARALGVAEAHYARGPEAVLRATLAGGSASVRSIDFDRLRETGWARLDLPRPYMPFASGAPTPSGKVEFYSASLAGQGLPALPTYVPLREGPASVEATARFPLQCLVPPNRFFLNSSFSQSERLRRRQGAPTVMIAPGDAEARGISTGDAVEVASARGATRFTAHVTDATRPGVVVIEGIWWHRFHPGGANVNVLTSDRVTDIGGGPALHSNLVEVTRAAAGKALTGSPDQPVPAVRVGS